MELLKLKRPKRKPKVKVATKAYVSFNTVLALDYLLRDMLITDTAYAKEIRKIADKLRE